VKEKSPGDQAGEDTGLAGGDDRAECGGDEECAMRGGDIREFPGEHGIQDTGTGKRVDEAKRIASAVGGLTSGNAKKCSPIHSAIVHVWLRASFMPSTAAPGS